MQVKSYRARTLHEALAQVRQELGPDAAVLEAREVRRGWLKSWFGTPQVEVTASCEVAVPSRYVAARESAHADLETVAVAGTGMPTADAISYRDQFRSALKQQATEANSPIDELCHVGRSTRFAGLPDTVFQLYAKLVEAEVPEELAQEWLHSVRARCTPEELNDGALLQDRLLAAIEGQMAVRGPIEVTPGTRRLVALVGPTGVGKTTTIAKLAANFRLREKRQVGLITVDTYRIAAVEQLRTYADIIDLPMEVVATPREMRDAVNRLSHLDLVLLDTAGRSPRDEIRIQELKSLLAEAGADEVHLVLSAASGASGLRKTAEHFAAVGTTSLLLTKLDEAMSLGGLLPFLCDGTLPISYVTNGQNVPDDIHAGDSHRLTRHMLGWGTL